MSKKYSNKPKILFTVMLALLSLVACGEVPGGSDQGEETNSGLESLENETATNDGNSNGNSLSLAAHQPGIAYHSAASGISSVVSSQSDTRLTVKPFSGPNAWIPLLNEGEIDIGILSFPDAGWAFNGENGYPEKNENLRMLVNGNNIVTSGLTVKADSDIKEVADLKGKRVASDYSGNQIIPRILEAQLLSVGLSWEDVERVPVTEVDSGINALRENRADAAFTGTPTVAAFTEMDTTSDIDGLNWGGVSPKDIEEFPTETVKEMAELVPGIQPVTFENGFLNSEKTLVSYPIILAASSHVSGEDTYELVKTLWNNYEELHSQFAWLETWEPETMFNEDPPVPYHPGAVEFFKEEGVWTDEAEENQQELLNQVD
ncbi:TAXI family TRAP transporter solute-binding subunit [Salipaludibacillus sp. CF4.18]|uniref:TAXI family TRAP transporter solute-binding subunit n=1 Tax=Salipaludibacillus sp. CF4.18 TaxID=3373081 RepID=UPI003EE66E83